MPSDDEGATRVPATASAARGDSVSDSVWGARPSSPRPAPNSPLPGLLDGDAMYRPHHTADRFVGPHAVEHGSRDDVRVVHPIAVAVEGAVVHDDRLVTDDNAGARRGVEKDPDAIAALKDVPHELIAARERGEDSGEGVGSGRDLVVLEYVVGHQEPARVE